MAWLEGRTLEDLLHDGTLISLCDALRMAAQPCHALTSTRAGVHRAGAAPLRA